MSSFILIHQTIWPQYTNVTQTGQTDRQGSDSIGRTVLQTITQYLFTVKSFLLLQAYEDL